ncbi:hypothetical protein EON80_24950 [bacterium]|nr:MAG: hypothetical protein EON80_24950 [bacterium]
MTIRKLQSNDPLPAAGVVFWWSNILRSFQLRVYSDGRELVGLRELHIDRTSVEAVAHKLAIAMNLALFEVEIEQLDFHTLGITAPTKP